MIGKWKVVRVVATAVLTTVAVASPAATAAQSGCSDVTFLGARGSGEPLDADGRGMGRSVAELGERLERVLDGDGLTMRYMPVPYEAASATVLRPSTWEAAHGLLSGPVGRLAGFVVWKRKRYDRYVASIEDGIAKTNRTLASLVGRCPETEVVMAGYSQGAMVVHQAQLRLADAGRDDLLDAVAGTVLLADGDRVPHSRAKLVGDAPARGSGIRTWVRGVQRRDVWDPETTVQICADGDLVCDTDGKTIAGAVAASKVHTGYASRRTRLFDEAIGWFAAELGFGPEAATAARGVSVRGASARRASARGAAARGASARRASARFVPARAAGRPVVLRDCRGTERAPIVVRPAEIECGAVGAPAFSRLRWRRWGRGVARANGYVVYRVCEPGRGCADPRNYHRVRTRLSVSGLRTCDGRRAYTRLHARFREVTGRPNGYRLDLTSAWGRCT